MMASARRTGTNENISTFGDGTRDYTSIVTWEAATDNDLVTQEISEVLECYDDSSPYSISSGISIGGATTNSSYFRIIRAATGHRHNGVFGGGVRLHYAVAASGVLMFFIAEDYFSLEDIEIALTANPGNNDLVQVRGDEQSYIGVISDECNDDGIVGVSGGTNFYVIDCIFVGMGSTSVKGLNPIVYNSTFIDSGTIALPTGTTIAKNCIVQGSGTADYGASVTTTTCISEDASGDIQATLTFNDAANDDYSLDATDTVAIDAGTDLSSDVNYPFNDDIAFNQFGSDWEIGAFSFVIPPVSDAVTLNRTTRAYGTGNGEALYELNLIQSSNFVYHTVRDGETDATTYVQAHVDSFSFFTDLEEAEAIAALIVAGGV